MALRLVLLTVVTTLWIVSICDVITASTTAALPNDRNATAASVNCTTQQAGVTSSAAAADFNCLTHWLRISGASVDDVTSLVASGQLTLARLDENTIQTQPAFLLTIILQHKRNLTNNLKTCIARHTVCPSGSKVTDYPCAESGKCGFNVTTKTTSCQCPRGLQGVRCQQDIDECSSTKLNNCASDELATCANSHGSYFCTCNEGYFGDGVQCSDLDECSQNIHDCDGNANCTNAIGSYQCSCKTGFYGDGRRCQEDICQGAKDAALCAKVLEIGDFNQRLQSKLEQRDKRIQRMHSDMRLMAALFTRYDTKINTLSTELAQDRQRLEEISEKITTDTAEKTSSTYRRLENLSERVKKQFTALDSKMTHTISQEMQRTQQRVNILSDTLEGVKASEERKCGLVSWKTFTQRWSSSEFLSWNAVFNKTRADTVIRVTYTSTFGLQAYGSEWTCFTRSVLINGSECSDPAPIRSGATAYGSGNGVFSFILPGSISGICKVPQAGLLTLSVSTEKHCQKNTARFKYDGYYQGSGNRVTSSIHVEELCAN